MLIGYARVSTRDQDPALQRDALRRAGCEQVYTETASGADDARPVLRRVLNKLASGDVLVVWRLDRLGRSLRHLVETIETLRDRGVGFRSVTESIDTTTAGGRLVFAVFGALAEFERELIRERTMAGLAAARDRGRKGGRRPVLDADGKKAARDLLATGWTLDETASHLGVSKRTIQRAKELTHD